MALFIGKTDGSTNFDVGQVEIDMIAIVKGDMGIGFDEANPQTIEGVISVPVTYSRNETGPTPERLDVLANNTGINVGSPVSYVSPPHIIVFAVDDSFTLTDGTTVIALAGNGIAFQAGDPFSPFTSHVAAFYDQTLCGGAGVWVVKQGGGDTVQQTTAIILYHELSHCFHFVTGTTASTSAQEEINAETDENDMHDVQNVPHREVTSHLGGCGGGCPHGGVPPDCDCCIIASLATGSPYSNEVGRFRYLREHILRRSEVGDDFFKHFFYHYYGFSPEVCRLMGHRPTLSPLIRNHFVVPLLAGIELLIHYADHKGLGLVDLLRHQAEVEELAEIHRPEFLNELKVYLSLVETHNQTAVLSALLNKGEDVAGIADLLRYVNEQTIKDDFINWSLVAVVKIWLSSALLLTTEKTDEEINAEIHDLISEWIAYLPITSIWGEFSRLETENELNSLEQFIFDHRSKGVFSKRLIAEHPKYATTIRRWAQN
jgi:hypothetical protein